MMLSYPQHFNLFIQEKLPTYTNTFTVEDTISWVQFTEPGLTPKYIRDHLLKRTTNHESRDNFIPPSTLADDLFFQIGPNLFRRYQSGVDPEPFPSNKQNLSGSLADVEDTISLGQETWAMLLLHSLRSSSLKPVQQATFERDLDRNRI
jgi:hypothetical protein